MSEEVIIAVPRKVINETLLDNPFGFISDNVENLYIKILSNCIQMIRSHAENDNSHKQIIPYVLINYKEKFFLSRRKNTQTEKRLHNKMSIGFGGHINPVDYSSDYDLIIGGLIREIREEINIGDFSIPQLIGFINDDVSEVGQVHIGLLFEIELNYSEIEIIEKDKMDGRWVTIAEMEENYEYLESWSKIAFDSYVKKKNIWPFKN
ncbi:hypothetical protein [Fibrella aestuarina]|uniref:hypothetical protein n=1 Tax=Fibrella aestuarina TaxID=651143 RepID=UPI0006882D01|nr:hypothetical protein [Fibrella aestuarina]